VERSVSRGNADNTGDHYHSTRGPNWWRPKWSRDLVQSAYGDEDGWAFFYYASRIEVSLLRLHFVLNWDGERIDPDANSEMLNVKDQGLVNIFLNRGGTTSPVLNRSVPSKVFQTPAAKPSSEPASAQASADPDPGLPAATAWESAPKPSPGPPSTPAPTLLPTYGDTTVIPDEVKTQPESIPIRLNERYGQKTWYKVRTAMKIGKVFELHASRIGVEAGSLRLFLNGERIDPDYTPKCLLG
jgi:hypothetical protein